jgi:hypothetical protein
MRSTFLAAMGAALLTAAVALLAGCAKPQAQPAAQAPDTIEMLARVTGLLGNARTLPTDPPSEAAGHR